MWEIKLNSDPRARMIMAWIVATWIYLTVLFARDKPGERLSNMASNTSSVQGAFIIWVALKLCMIMTIGRYFYFDVKLKKTKIFDFDSKPIIMALAAGTFISTCIFLGYSSECNDMHGNANGKRALLATATLLYLLVTALLYVVIPHRQAYNFIVAVVLLVTIILSGCYEYDEFTDDHWRWVEYVALSFVFIPICYCINCANLKETGKGDESTIPLKAIKRKDLRRASLDFA